MAVLLPLVPEASVLLDPEPLSPPFALPAYPLVESDVLALVEVVAALLMASTTELVTSTAFVIAPAPELAISISMIPIFVKIATITPPIIVIPMIEKTGALTLGLSHTDKVLKVTVPISMVAKDAPICGAKVNFELVSSNMA